MTMPAARRLRSLLADHPVVAAGCFDPFSARLAELAGFEAVHLSGFCVELTQLGAPDLGLLTLTELASHAARVTAAISVPVLADIDTGFGGVLNVHRTIREMQRAGVAGVHLEDQVVPKRCPLLAGRRVLERSAAVERVAAACDARTDPDFVVVARSDADVVSFDEVVARCNLYLQAGADLVMPMLMEVEVDGRPYGQLAPEEQVDLLRRLAASVDGPLMGMGGPPPRGYTAKDMGELGFSFWMFAASGLSAAANAMSEMYADLLEHGTDENYVITKPGPYHDPALLMDNVHLEHYARLERGR